MQAQVLEYERLELDHFWEIHRRQLEDRDLERLGASPPPNSATISSPGLSECVCRSLSRIKEGSY